MSTWVSSVTCMILLCRLWIFNSLAHGTELRSDRGIYLSCVKSTCGEEWELGKEVGRSWGEGLAQGENGMRTAQTSPRRSFFVIANVTFKAAGKHLFKGKTRSCPRDSSALQEKLQNVGSEPSLMCRSLGYGRGAYVYKGGAHLPQQASCRQTTEGQFPDTSLASSTL